MVFQMLQMMIVYSDLYNLFVIINIRNTEEATILPYAIILTKAHRTAVSMMGKGCIVARILPLRCFLFLLPN